MNMTIEEPVFQTQQPLVSVGTSTDIIVSTKGVDLFFKVDDHRRQRVLELTSNRVCRTGNGLVPNVGLVQVPNVGNVPGQAIIPSDEFSYVFPIFFHTKENIMD